MVRALVFAGEIEEARKAAQPSAPIGGRPIDADVAIKLAPYPWFLAGEFAAANRTADVEKELARITDDGVRLHAMFSAGAGFLACDNLNEAIHYLELAKWFPSDGSDYFVLQRATIACAKAGRLAEALRFWAKTPDHQRGSIIDELVRCGRWDDVEKLAGQRPPSMTRWNQFVLGMCRHNQADRLLAALQPPSSNAASDYRAVASIARIWASGDDPKAVAAWARKLLSPAVRCAALIAVAKGNALAEHPPIQDSSGQDWYPKLF